MTEPRPSGSGVYQTEPRPSGSGAYYVLLILRLIMAAVFLYAAYTKLREPWLVFAMAIDAYQLLPQWAVLTLGRTIPWLELLLGLLLATGFALRIAAPASAILLGVFFGIMAHAYAQGLKIDCGCFGLGEPISAQTLLRDGLLLAVSLTLTFLALRPRSIPRAHLGPT